jgi:MFS transporter, DHA2 family, methylenomycin A resistance protein
MTETEAGLHRSFPIITVAVTSLGFLLVQMDGSVLNVALSEIGNALRTGINDLQWTVDAYFVAFAVLLLSAGSLSDRWGARRVFVTGFTVFSVASLACGLAPNAAALIAARAVQGVGAALLVPCSLALLNGACGNDAGIRARAVGLWTAAGGVGIAAGPILGGLLIGFLGWRSIFFVNLPIGVAGVWLTLRFLDQPAPAEKKRGLDLTGQTFIAVAILGLVGAIIEAGPSGWRSPLVLSGIVLAIAGGAGFIVVERRTPDPAVPIELFRNMSVNTTMLVGFAVNAVMFGITFAFALYFQRVLSFTTVETGIAFLPFALMVTAANVIGGRCVARFGLRGPMCIGLVIAGAGCGFLLGIITIRPIWRSCRVSYSSGWASDWSSLRSRPAY